MTGQGGGGLESGWLLVGLLVLVAAAGSFLVVVGPGRTAVVLRGGVVRRVLRPGIGVRTPLVEDLVPVTSEPQEVPVLVRARTDDGFPVLVLADVRARPAGPVVGEPLVDASAVAERTTEDAIRDEVGQWPMARLREAMAGVEPALLGRVRPAASARGVDVLDLEVVEVDILLTFHDGDERRRGAG